MKNRNTLFGTRSRWLCAIALLAALALAPALLASCDDGSGGGGSALDGRWSHTGGALAINISGATGVITSLTPGSGSWLDAKNKGMIKVGDQYFRNIRQTGERTWSAQMVFVWQNNNVAEYVYFDDVTLTLNANGRSFVRSGITASGTWNRQ